MVCFDSRGNEVEKRDYMNNLLIAYPKCSTCQKAKKWLEEHNIEFAERHIVDDRPLKEELRKWYLESGLPLKRFFNTSGLKYKELGLKDKLPMMSEEEQLDLLSSDGMLVKRPLFITPSRIYVGFKEKEWSHLES